MEPTIVYECLGDATRLRVLRLLAGGPLCVCHIQEALDEPQVKVSKHLAYLKQRGVVSAERRGNWMVYALPGKIPALLRANLDALSDPASGGAVFRRDDARLAKLRAAGALACE